MFKKVKHTNNWQHIEVFYGKTPFTAGEYNIKFPDGTVERHTVNIVDLRIPYNDMGHEYYGYSEVPQITLDYHGHKIKHMLHTIRGLSVEKIDG